jgi:hypothetical protein
MLARRARWAGVPGEGGLSAASVAVLVAALLAVPVAVSSRRALAQAGERWREPSACGGRLALRRGGAKRR